MNDTRLLGAHMPTTGGLHKAITGGHEIGCTAVQLFTASPRQWRSAPLSDEAVQAFQQAVRETNMGAVVSHDSYLVNLAAPSAEVMEKSRIAFREELDRCEQLGIPWVVTHMGSHLGEGEEAGLQRLIDSARYMLESTRGYTVGIAMESTAGQGSNLGYRLEHLRTILDGCDGDQRLGVCLDTCHLFAAGYDLVADGGVSGLLDTFDALIGLDRLKVFHANDALKPLGSRVDRHAHIGDGTLGIEVFRALLNEPRIRHVPVIIETPESETMHPENLRRLRELLH